MSAISPGAGSASFPGSTSDWGSHAGCYRGGVQHPAYGREGASSDTLESTRRNYLHKRQRETKISCHLRAVQQTVAGFWAG